MIREENINCTVEALILASSEPVSMKRICEVMTEITPARIRQAVDDLNNIYMGCGNSFRIREVGGGYQVYILPDFEAAVKKLLTRQRTVRLTRPALETLAIIAYKQPVTKIEIEHIRGVATDGVLHNLLERRLILIAGRSETPGRPLLYKTSNEFLKFFGLNRLSDLPRLEEIEEMIRQSDTPREQTELPFNGGNGSRIAAALADELIGEAQNDEQAIPIAAPGLYADDSGNGNGDHDDPPCIIDVESEAADQGDFDDSREDLALVETTEDQGLPEGHLTDNPIESSEKPLQ